MHRTLVGFLLRQRLMEEAAAAAHAATPRKVQARRLLLSRSSTRLMRFLRFV